jgi:hypothetical protein
VKLTLREEHRLRLFVSRVLRKIFGPNWSKITGDWRKLHNEELNVLCFSPNTIRVIKSRRMRWEEHVARRERGEDVLTGFLWGNIRERDDFEDLGVDERMILKLLFKKWYGDMDWIDLAQGRDRVRTVVKVIMKVYV